MNDDIGCKNFDHFRIKKLGTELSAERRDHRTTRKYLTAYRWLALVGWLGMVVVLTMKEI